MKKLLLVLFLGSCVSAFGQGARFGDANPTQTTAIVPGTSGLLVKVIPGATINFCSWPANAVPCTNKATTYTDYTLQTSCPTSTQVVLSATTNCVGTADSNGNWGVWVAPGLYQYTFTYQGNNYGPFFAIPTGNGVSTLNCPNAANLAAGTAAVGAMTSVTGFNCDPNFLTDLAGNASLQSARFLGPVNGFYGLIGGASDPGTQAKFKLGTNEVRMLAPLTVPTPYYWRWPSTTCAVGQVWQMTGETTDANGDKVDTYGCLTPSGGVSATATSPIVVTPSPGTGAFVISCPTCNSTSHPTMATPSAPTVTPGGTPGSTAYSYKVVICEDGPTCAYHTAASSAGSTSTGNATLSSTNYNLLSAYVDSYSGQLGRCINVYRTAGGATQGLIGNCVWKQFKDTGLTGDSTTAPSTNTTTLDETGLTAPLPGCNKIWASPWGIDSLPCTNNAFNDEFTWGNNTWAPGDANNPNWAWVNQGSATATLSNGALIVTSDTMASSNLEMLASTTALPATPYTFTAFVSTLSSTSAGGCILGLRESSTSKVVTAFIFSNTTVDTLGGFGTLLAAYNWTSNTTNANIHQMAYRGESYYLRVQNTGSNIVISWSPPTDGINYYTLATEAVTTGFTTAPNQLVIGTNSSTATASCTFDYVRRTQ